jgi:hypothetical protein
MKTMRCPIRISISLSRGDSGIGSARIVEFIERKLDMVKNPGIRWRKRNACPHENDVERGEIVDEADAEVEERAMAGVILWKVRLRPREGEQVRARYRHKAIKVMVRCVARPSLTSKRKSSMKRGSGNEAGSMVTGPGEAELEAKTVSTWRILWQLCSRRVVTLGLFLIRTSRD